MKGNSRKNTFQPGWLIMLLMIFWPALSGLMASPESEPEIEGKILLSEKWEEITNGEKYFDKSIFREAHKIDPPPEPHWNEFVKMVISFFIINWKYFAYGFLILVLAVLIYLLISEKILFKKPSKNVFDTSASLENFDEETETEALERLLEQAIVQNRFSEAVRIKFLLLLRMLDQLNILRFGIAKTNHSYIQEYGHKIQVDDFRTIVLIYEKAWYGNFAITQNDFKQIDVLFNKFHQNIAADEK